MRASGESWQLLFEKDKGRAFASVILEYSRALFPKTVNVVVTVSRVYQGIEGHDNIYIYLLANGAFFLDRHITIFTLSPDDNL